jgi:hypothetical protein
MLTGTHPQHGCQLSGIHTHTAITHASRCDRPALRHATQTPATASQPPCPPHQQLTAPAAAATRHLSNEQLLGCHTNQHAVLLTPSHSNSNSRAHSHACRATHTAAHRQTARTHIDTAVQDKHATGTMSRIVPTHACFVRGLHMTHPQHTPPAQSAGDSTTQATNTRATQRNTAGDLVQYYAWHKQDHTASTAMQLHLAVRYMQSPAPTPAPVSMQQCCQLTSAGLQT